VKVKCIKCGKEVRQTPENLEKVARSRNMTFEDYVKNYVCRNCSTSKVSEKDNNGLYVTSTCLKCAKPCKIKTISKKAILTCPKFERIKEDAEEEGESYEEV